MGNKLYVGNLPFDVTDDDLNNAFAAHGEVVSARVISDKWSGKSRGFGFVEMADQDQAQQAIENMNGKDLGGRQIVVNEARPTEKRGGSGGGGGGGGRRSQNRRGGGGGGSRQGGYY